MIKFTLLLLSFSLQAAAPTPPAYVYLPVSKAYWDQVQEALKDQNYTRVVKIAEARFKETKRDSLEYAEAQVSLGLALSKLKLPFGATAILSQVVKEKVGTQTALEALNEIESISQKNPVDEDELYGELINDLEFDSLPPNLQSFISYHQGLFSLFKGYTAWAEDDLKKIEINSYWDYKLKYSKALDDVAKDKLDSAIERFSSLSSQQLTPADIKNQAVHQYARLIFEKGDYEQAYKILKNVQLNPREKGLILLERAWAKYYQKDYSKALGLLAAMEAPIFDTARSPEPYILKMIMFKELCYYNSALKVVGEFNKRFGNSLRMIKKRQDLRKDQMIVNMSVIDKRLEKWVSFLNNLKEERTTLLEYSWKGYSFYNDLLRRYNLKIKETTDKLNWWLTDKTRETANKLLDWEEQITFLDFQTRIDSLRVNRGGELDYKPEVIPHMTFDKMFWENNGEFWMDELENYKVQVESRCSEVGL